MGFQLGESPVASRFTTSTFPRSAKHNEIFHAFSPQLHKSESTASDSDRFGTNADTCAPASAERAARNLKEYAACASSKNRDFAAHDLAIRCVHQLPGKRRCKWQQHSWRRGERARDCSRPDRR